MRRLEALAKHVTMSRSPFRLYFESVSRRTGHCFWCTYRKARGLPQEINDASKNDASGSAHSAFHPATSGDKARWPRCEQWSNRIGESLSALVVALLSIVMTLLSSTMSDYMEETVLFAAGAAPLVLVLGLMVAMNIELKKLDKDSLADPEEML